MQIAVITGPTFEIAKKRVLLANECRDGIELRLDLFSNLNMEEISTLIQLCKGRVILTLRSRLNGGNYTGAESKRLNRLKELATLGADYIDIEYETDREFTQDLSQSNPKSKIISSYHNFDRTPQYFETVYKKMSSNFSYAYKICSRATSISDSYKMLRFIQVMQKRRINFIGLCMGADGRITRKEGLKAGNYLNYTVLHHNDSCSPGLYLA